VFLQQVKKLEIKTFVFDFIKLYNNKVDSRFSIKNLYLLNLLHFVVYLLILVNKMIYCSTRDNSNKVNSMEAVLKGLADDGGLYVPESLPKLEINFEELCKMTYQELTAYVLNAILPDFGEDSIRYCVNDGYDNKFDVPTCVDVKKIEGEYFLELFHGPTSAFKDMALCVLPRLMACASQALGNSNKIVILTATSGDTGKAALEGFAGAKGTEIFVFYPNEGVSEIQKIQMATQEGDNVHVCGITGNFDDAQTAVKKAFQNLSIEGYTFSSANSINIGRLAPQIAYYFWAYICLVKSGDLKAGDKLNFSVPTGNFGDILAGWIAKKMGLPIGKLLCASNKNNVLTEFFETAVYNKNRAFYVTASPSMDILVSSNLERLLFYASGCNGEYVKALMNNLNEKGQFEITKEMLEIIRSDFDFGFVEDEDCFDSIKNVFEKSDYLMDTHTAVAYSCARNIYKNNPCVVLSTANPYKFSPAIIKALGGKTETGFNAMDKLLEMSKVAVPKALSSLKTKIVLHKDVIDACEIENYITGKLV